MTTKQQEQQQQTTPVPVIDFDPAVETRAATLEEIYALYRVLPSDAELSTLNAGRVSPEIEVPLSAYKMTLWTDMESGLRCVLETLCAYRAYDDRIRSIYAGKLGHMKCTTCGKEARQHK